MKEQTEEKWDIYYFEKNMTLYVCTRICPKLIISGLPK